MNNEYNIKKLFISFVKDIFTSNTDKNNYAHFPTKINNYSFVRRVPKIGIKGVYLFGLYKNEKNQKAIGKMINIKNKSYHYLSLKNEITNYKVLNSTLKEIGNKMPVKYKKFKIPKLISTYENENELVMLTQYCKGRPSSELNSKQKVKLFFESCDYLRFLGDKIRLKNRLNVTQRSRSDLLWLYPLLLTKAIINFPLFTPMLIRGISRVYKKWNIRNSIVKAKLVHRDLHFDNILHAQSKFILIDFQQCVFTDPLQEYVTIIRYFWNQDDRISQLILKELILKSNNIPSFVNRMRWLSVQSVTHGLTDKDVSPEIITSWINFLRYSLDKQSFQKLSLKHF